MNRDNQNEPVDLLQGLDASPDDDSAWRGVVQLLSVWPDRRITAADRTRLMNALSAALPQGSVVRQAIRDRLGRRSHLESLLATALSQVSVLRPSFWLLSGVLIALGVMVELILTQNPITLIALRALTPLLAYYSVANLFRGARLQALEWELACPPSPLQLISARLVIVLGYDVALGSALSLVGWLQGDGSFLAVTLYWLTPLLLTAGLALALSLRLSAPIAAGAAYIGWLVLLALGAGHQNVLLSIQGELLLILAGLALLGVALWRFGRQVPNHFLPLAS